MRIDREGRYVFANRAFLELLGKTFEEVAGRGPELVADLTHPDDYPRIVADGYAVLETGEWRESEIRYLHPDGTWHWMQHLAFPWYTPDGQIGGSEAVGRDITERKRVEEVLGKREAVLEAVSYIAERFLKAERWEDVAIDALKRLTEAADASRTVLLQNVFDADGGLRINCRYEWRASENTAAIHDQNSLQYSLREAGLLRWEQMLGAGQVVAGCADAYPPEERALFEREQTPCLALVPVFRRAQWWGLLEFDAGEKRQWHPAELDAFRTAAGIIGAAVEREEAERMIAEQQARMADSARLNSLGMLSSGVAHEINNPLAIIQVGVEQLQRMAQEGPMTPQQISDSAGRIIRNVERIERIIRSLRNLSRDGSDEAVVSRSLAVVVSEALELCRARCRTQGIRLEVNEPGEALVVECQPTLVGQVFANLLNNAFDAVESCADKWVRVEMNDLGGEVEASVADSGPGVPVHLRSRILEPFYTTKPLGRGTGLGLSISKSIIEAHQGALYLDTACAFTRFVVRLPKKSKRGRTLA